MDCFNGVAAVQDTGEVFRSRRFPAFVRKPILGPRKKETNLPNLKSDIRAHTRPPHRCDP
jgi:hypothetical protein